jgi:hypothetical protein
LQPLNFLIPIIELYQIEQGHTHQWCFEGFRALGWDALSVLIHQSIIIPSHQQNVTQLMQHGITIFSFHHRNFPKPSAGHLTRGV